MTTSSFPQPTAATSAAAGDAELLARFVKTGNGAAFSELVERHLGMVFGTACRRTESRELAQEAAQNTFCQLARHAARLRVGKSLAPWLHKVAFREAGTLLRSEASQQRRVRNLAESVAHGESSGFSSADIPGSSHGSSSPAAEHLDAALASLPETERRVILLRYLQGLSLRELAAAESSTEEAVRKRVSRALDRLTALLARRGVTASAMMGCLTHIPQWPAPPPANLALRAVREGTAASTSGGLAALAVSSWPMAAVFLAVAIPTAGPWSGGSPSSSGIPTLSAGWDNAGKPAKALTHSGKVLTPAVIDGLKRELLVMQAQTRAYTQQDVRKRVLNNVYSGNLFMAYLDPIKWAAIQSLIADLPADQLKVAAKELTGENGGGSLIASTLYGRWAELAPEEAREAAWEQAQRGQDEQFQAPLLGVLRVLARGDLGGTLKWAKTNAPASSRYDILRSLLEPLAAADPRAYLKWMADPSTSPAKPKMETVGAAPSPPGEEALCAVPPYDTSLALNGLRQGELNGSLELPILSIEREIVVKDQLKLPQLDAVTAFALDLPPESILRSQLLVAAGIALAEIQPTRAADLFAATPYGIESPHTGRTGLLWPLLRDWQDEDMNACLNWLSAHRDLYPDPDTLAILVRQFGLRMPETAQPSPVVIPLK